MGFTWRFYADGDGKWRWQKLGAERMVLAEADSGCESYESCIAEARKSGYLFEAAQARTVRPGNDERWRR